MVLFTRTHVRAHTHLPFSLKLVSGEPALSGHHRSTPPPRCVGIHAGPANYLGNVYIAFLAFIVQSVLYIFCFEFCNFVAF